MNVPTGRVVALGTSAAASSAAACATCGIDAEVDVAGDLRRGVAELLGDYLDVCAGGQCGGGRDVAQVVQRSPRRRRLAEHGPRWQ
jgi:hypothetical protein